MQETDLLRHVQPASGWLCLLAAKDKTKIRQLLFATREDFDTAAQELVQRGWDVFFGVARYATGENRTKDNVQSVKALWLDIDCGPTKAEVNPKTGRPDGYASQADGMRALQRFCREVKLPRPTLVNSGRGIHAYWVLDEELTRHQWEPMAARLRQLCNEHDLIVDPSVFEVARVLRVPGTFNFKDTPPKPVELMHVAPAISVASVRAALGVAPTVDAPVQKKRPLTALAASMVQNVEHKFRVIMQRAANNDGCQQLVSCYMDRATLAEPRWFDALSVAKFCSDKDSAIHRLSSGHPDYDYASTEIKIRHILGPHSCEQFEAHNPGGCEGCPHAGKIKSPIVLGKLIARSEPDAVVVEEQPEELEAEPLIHHIPAYPEPFFRGKTGGVYVQLDEEDSDDGDTGPKLVYENDLYITKLMHDPQHGFVAVFKHHLPMDGVREFVIPNTKITERSDLRKELARFGVVAGEARYKLITSYVIAFIRELQHKQKAELMRLQFGWADRDAAFIVGNKEITSEGVYHSPPSSTTQSLAPFFDCRGTLEGWKQVFSLYGRPGLEVQAFGALTGFGAPLLKFTGQKGAIINLIHPHSGTGKTTILRMANSIFGDPEMLLGTPDDTKVGRIIKIGILNNLANTLDEITNTSAEDASQLFYAFSQGRGKDKAKANANELRDNNTTWRTITLASSNASFYEKLTNLKESPDGELMRLLEFKIDYTDENVISVQEGKEMLDRQLNQNFGWAGEVYIQWIINNMEEVVAALLGVQKKLDAELRLSQRERNWSAVASANITGGLIAKRIGLIDWDMMAIYKAVSSKLAAMRDDVKPVLNSTSAIVGDFINRHMGNILVVDDGVDKRTNTPKFPIMEPKGPLYIRYEPDTKRLYIVAREFRNDCVKAQVNYKETLKELERMKILTEITTKRLSKGSKVIAPGVRCLVLDAGHPDFLDMAYIMPDGTEDVGGGS